tara:strand:- start:744 stop:986 length:243 start_codon:yes stop_codon:yes gene_type:complete
VFSLAKKPARPKKTKKQTKNKRKTRCPEQVRGHKNSSATMIAVRLANNRQERPSQTNNTNRATKTKAQNQNKAEKTTQYQ